MAPLFPLDQGHLTLEEFDFEAWYRLLSDDSRRVRRAAARRTHLLAGTTAASGQRLGGYLRQLHTQLEETATPVSTEHYETLVYAMGRAVHAVQGSAQLDMILGLITMLTQPDVRLHALALSELETAAASRSMSLKKMLEPFMKEISRSLVQNLEIEPIRAEYMQRLFETSCAEEFFTHTLGYTLPYLVMRRQDKALQRLAQLIKKEVTYLLAENAAKTFARVFTECPLSDMSAALEFLTGLLSARDITLSSLVKTDSQPILYDIVMNADLDRTTEGRSRFLQGLKMLAHYAGRDAAAADADGDAGGAEPPARKRKLNEGAGLITTSEDELHSFLRGYMIAIIFYLKNQIMQENESFRRRALRGLMAICRVAGAQNLALVRVQVFQVLLYTLKMESLMELSLEALYEFVCHVDRAVLPTILPQVAVTLLPHLDRHAASAARILRFLIVENRAQLRHLFKDIFFLPDHEDLKDVNSVLREQRDAMRARPGPQRLPERLRDLLTGLTHDSVDVRKVVLGKLYDTLSEHADDLQDTLMQWSEGAHDNGVLLSGLLGVLLSNCRESDRSVRRLCGKCLGLIGAVDPGRVLVPINVQEQHQQRQHQAALDAAAAVDAREGPAAATRHNVAPDAAGDGGRGAGKRAAGAAGSASAFGPAGKAAPHRIYYSLRDPDLGVELIGNFFVRALLTATTDRHQDHAAIALQECLKIFGCSPNLSVDMADPGVPLDRIEDPGERLWLQLAPEVRELVHPYLRSRYIWGKDRWKEPPPPDRQRFVPERGVRRWLHFWTQDLVWQLVARDHAEGRVGEAVSSDVKLFMASHGVMSDSINTAFFLLPYLVLKVLLAYAESAEASDSIAAEIHTVLCSMAADGEASGGEAAVAASPQAADALQIAVEAVFAILDHLHQWLYEQRRLRMKSKCV